MDDIYKKYENALCEIERLRQENNQLKRELGLTKLKNVAPSTKESRPMVEAYSNAKTSRLFESAQSIDHPTKLNHFSSVKEKIDLYLGYFRGREDVYPVRWTNKQGKSGYSPACGNEWTAVCQKPKVKCSACLHQNSQSSGWARTDRYDAAWANSHEGRCQNAYWFTKLLADGCSTLYNVFDAAE